MIINHIEDSKIPGIKIITPEVHKDDRGYFFESFNSNDFNNLGLPTHFTQDNQSFSKVHQGPSCVRLSTYSSYRLRQTQAYPPAREAPSAIQAPCWPGKQTCCRDIRQAPLAALRQVH